MPTLLKVRKLKKRGVGSTIKNIWIHKHTIQLHTYNTERRATLFSQITKTVKFLKYLVVDNHYVPTKLSIN